MSSSHTPPQCLRVGDCFEIVGWYSVSLHMNNLFFIFNQWNAHTHTHNYIHTVYGYRWAWVLVNGLHSQFSVQMYEMHLQIMRWKKFWIEKFENNFVNESCTHIHPHPQASIIGSRGLKCFSTTAQDSKTKSFYYQKHTFTLWLSFFSKMGSSNTWMSNFASIYKKKNRKNFFKSCLGQKLKWPQFKKRKLKKENDHFD